MKKIIVALLLFFSFSFLHAQTAVDTIQPQQKSFIEKTVGKYLDNLNYFTVTLFMTIESSFIPFPSEIVVPPAAYGACNPENPNFYVTDSKILNILFVTLFATLGAIIGALINYYLAYFLGRPFVYWFVETKFGKLLLLSKKGIEKAENYFIKNGNISTFIGRLIPAIRQLISIPAGLAKMNVGKFVLYTSLGAFFWNVILSILGYLAHGQKDLIDKYAHELTLILLGLGLVFGIYLIIKGLNSKKSQQDF